VAAAATADESTGTAPGKVSTETMALGVQRSRKRPTKGCKHPKWSWEDTTSSHLTRGEVQKLHCSQML